MNQKKKILLVDDIREFLSMLKLMLARDFDVITAANGREALGLLEDGLRPDAIVTDLCMPYMDGYELISNVKESNDYKKIPVIVLSNSDRNKDKEDALNKGVYTYIRKSFIPQEFRTELNHSLSAVFGG